MNSLLQILSAAMLLLGSGYFGIMSQPTEMGLAIIAGSLGLAFSNIDKFSEFSGGGFSAKLKDQIEAVIDKETEDTPDCNFENLESDISKPEKNVLLALADEKYTWRTLPGVSKAVGCPESEARTILDNLVNNDCVRAGNKNKTGEMIWSLTIKGRQLVA